MKIARWIDHLPPWISFGAITTTGVFSPLEIIAMALPLVAAAGVEAQRLHMARYRRVLEIAALVALAGQILLRIGLVPTTVITLFVLCGIRLTLPREAPQRRQLLLMGFLLFLVTAIATFEMDFLFWALAWTAGSGLVLFHHAWEASAALRKSHAQPPPYRYILPWTAAALVLASLCFAAMPRKTLGLRFFPWSAGGISGSAAGLSDSVDLSGLGPISGNREVVLRLIPSKALDAGQRQRYENAFGLLRGITLEGLEGQRWEALADTPPPLRTPGTDFDWDRLINHPDYLGAEFSVAPNPFGIIPLPMGSTTSITPQGMPIRSGFGGSTRWAFPSRRPVSLKVLVDLGSHQIGRLSPRRMALLTTPGEATEAALAWSRRVAPEAPSASALAQRLSRELGSYAYTTSNPSGRAPNPLQDFLERTRAGHCEYFASALALALRHRGVAARVVNGYRLGPWIEEGGYWLVTQDQAHSWVEYYDPESLQWRMEDPTPSAPSEGLSSQSLWAAVQRWTEAVRFRWDRNVVRFSDEDQQEGLAWLQAKGSSLPNWRPDRKAVAALGGGLLVLLALRFLIPRWLRRRAGPGATGGPQGIAALKPLLRKTGRQYPPESGETARTWLQRVGTARPDLEFQLTELAEETDAVAYGGRGDARLKPMVRHLARLLRQQKR